MDKRKPVADRDLGQKSLEDALSTSFRILKWAMIIVVLAMLFSGVFSVGPDERAVIVRLGKIAGAGKVHGPGLHLAWPYPIDSIIKVPVGKIKSLDADGLWYRKGIDEKRVLMPDMLSPVEDGYTISGDMNILHSKWTIKYKISDIVDYLTGVEDIEELLRCFLYDAVIKVSGRYTIDAAWREQQDQFKDDVVRELQSRLANIKCGVSISSLERQRAIPPLQTARAFFNHQMASDEQKRILQDVENFANNQLNRAAGVQWEKILEKIAAVQETESASDEKARIAAVESLNAALESAAGEAARIISDAQAYKEAIVEETAADAQALTEILKEFKGNPELQKIYVDQRYLDTIREVLGSAREKFIIDSSGVEELRIMVPRDPDIEKEERKKRQEELLRR